MLIGDADLYLDLDYASPTMESIIPVQAMVDGVFGGAPPIVKMDGWSSPYNYNAGVRWQGFR